MKNGKITKSEIKERQFLERMKVQMKHPNQEYMKNWLYHMFLGVGLTPEYLRNAYKDIYEYLMQDVTRIDPCLHGLHYHVIETLDGKTIDSWLSLVSDGTRQDHPKGEEYRLDLNEVQNLWLLVKNVV